MADFPPPVGNTASTSRPPASASTARSCPGRSRSKPSRSRASSSITAAPGTAGLRLLPSVAPVDKGTGMAPRWMSGPEDPLVVTDDLHCALRARTGDGHTFAADHDIGVDGRAVEPDLIPLLVALRQTVRHRERKALAPRNVAGLVLVEQHVVEQDAGLRDPRVPVNERDLAEAAGALVGVELSPYRLHTRRRCDVSDAPAGERDLQSLDHLAADDHRLGQADHAVGAAPVGAREDLLSRDVRHVCDAVRVVHGTTGPSAVRHEPDRE